MEQIKFPVHFFIVFAFYQYFIHAITCFLLYIVPQKRRKVNKIILISNEKKL
jgi:hypothetical protein